MKRFIFFITLFILSGCQNSESEQEVLLHEKNKVPQEEIVSKPLKEEVKIASVLAAGDNLIHSQIYEDAEIKHHAYDFKPIYQYVQQDIEGADLAFINQETIIGGVELTLGGYPAFNTPSEMAENLRDIGFDLVNGGTNHSLDRGTKGIQNVLQTWGKYPEVLYTGIFNSQQERDNIPTIERNGVVFSLLSYTYGTNGIEPEAPYQVNYFDKELIKNDVNKAKRKSDVVLVSAHWGNEHEFQPTDLQKSYAQLFADLGVDAVIGTHSHTIQPIEWVKGKDGNETLVAYSLGNFLAATNSDKNLLGGMLSFDVAEGNEGMDLSNVHWTPTVVYYSSDEKKGIEGRENFVIYKLEDYTTEKSEKHALFSIEGENVSPEHYRELTEEIINERFLEN